MLSPTSLRAKLELFYRSGCQFHRFFRPRKLAILARSCYSLESTLITSNALAQGGTASSISSQVRNLLQTANQVSNNITMLKTAVLQKVIAAADHAPLGVEALSHSFLQTITPLCSGGDLGNRPSSLDACISLFSRTSQTLLGKPIASDASNNILNTAAGILASFAVNVSQSPGISSILNTNDAMLQIQNILNVTMATVCNMAKQAAMSRCHSPRGSADMLLLARSLPL